MPDGPKTRWSALSAGTNLRRSARKAPLVPITPHLEGTHLPELAGQLAEARVGDGVREVAQGDVEASVALARRGQDRVGTGQHATVDALGEVHPEERELRVRHRVDEAA